MVINEHKWWLNALHYKNIMLIQYMNNTNDCYSKWQAYDMTKYGWT